MSLIYMFKRLGHISKRSLFTARDISQAGDILPTQKPDAANSVCQRERRRREHNDLEKKRKLQIKACICRMGELLPPTYITAERHSTLEVVEKSLNYMRELKEAWTKFNTTEENLQQEIDSLKTERDKLTEIIKAAGLSTESIPTNGVSSTTDVRDDSPKPKLKLKRRSTFNTNPQLQDLRDKEKQQQQEMISSSVSFSQEQSSVSQNQLLNMQGGAYMNGQDIMFNPLMLQAGNQFIMPGIVGNGSQMIQNMGNLGMVNTGMGLSDMRGGSIHDMSSNGLNLTLQNERSLNKSTDETDVGLLQLAMQDAGITPGLSQHGSASLTPSAPDGSQETESVNMSQNNPLQTLASVATGSQEMSANNSSSSDNMSLHNSMTGSLSSSNQNIAGMSSSQSGLQSMMQNGSNTFVNMQIMGNQHGLQGHQQMQQIMFINEQGIPMIASVPLGLDLNGGNMLSNTQKQGLLPGLSQQNLLKDLSGNLDQNALALAQQQANIATFQNQLLGQSANLTNMQFQQQNLLQGNIIQTPNGQLLQQIGQHMQTQLQGQGQLIGMQSQGQGIVVAGKQCLSANHNGSFMGLNMVPSQPNQLPSALILPNGQIIPVVTNPSSIVSQSTGVMFNQSQISQQRMSGQHIQTGHDGQMFSVQGSHGLLMTASSAGHLASNSSTVSLSTNVIPTSTLQSVMTTQIQGSTVHKMISASTGQHPSLSGQSKLTTLIPSGPNMSGLVSSGIIQPGGKSNAAPILISLPINGQPTTVLLDPVTMQVLGTVQQQMQQAPASIPISQNSTSSQASVTQPSALAPSTSSSTKKKNKNNVSQRSIYPKQILTADGLRTENTSSQKKRPSKANTKSKELVEAETLSDTLKVEIPESTTEPESTSALSSESTDILAKATESIFSSPVGDMSAVGGFYNPANEDNPLHIDTSATELEDESKSSPQKNQHESHKVSVPNVMKSATLEGVIGLNSVADGASNMDVVTVNYMDSSSIKDNVSSLSATLEEVTGMRYCDSSDHAPHLFGHESVEMSNKIVKNTKVANSCRNDGKKNENISKATYTIGFKNSTSSKRKKHVPDKTSNILNLDKDSDSQSMDIDSTLIQIPDVISFSENDLSDVLDQVEQFSNSDSPKTFTGKKSKSRRSKVSSPDLEPSAKKRKNVNNVKNNKSGTPAKELLSMPLSVYDFDDSDDMVPNDLHLNSKDFTMLTNSTIKSDFIVNDTVESHGQRKENKSKNGAHNKKLSGSKPSKSGKNSDVKDGVSIERKDNNVNMSVALDVTEPNIHIPKAKKETKKIKKSDKNLMQIESKVSDSVPSVPDSLPSVSADSVPSVSESDTTTSLFGFPVPKKLQRPDCRQNADIMSAKDVSQVSPKPNPQSNSAVVNIVSHKQGMLSLNSNSSMVYPKQTFSPELISPKLTIVSPGQDGNHVHSFPDIYQEISPLKKCSPSKIADNMKVSSFSALNSLSDTVVSPAVIVKDKHTTSVISHSTGVISSTKSASSAHIDSNKSSGDFVQHVECSPAVDVAAFEAKTMATSCNTLSSNINGQKSQKTRSASGSNNFTSGADNLFITPSVMANKNSAVSSHRVVASVNSHNNRFESSSQYGSEPLFGMDCSLNSRALPKESTSNTNSISSINNTYSPPYSADSLFSMSSEKVIKSPQSSNIPALPSQEQSETSDMSKIRNNPYSVDSFVQSSREDTIRSRPGTLGSHSDLISGPELCHPPRDFSRLQNESSPDGFNFANIGLNLQPITSTGPGSFMDSSSALVPNMPSSFSFSLSSTSSSVPTTTSVGHHQFPFFPVLSSSSSIPSSQNVSSMSGMGMYSSSSSSSSIHRNPSNILPSSSDGSIQSSMLPSSAGCSNLQRSDNSIISREVDKSSAMMADDVNRNQCSTKPSCSKQKIPKGSGNAVMHEAFTRFSNASSTHDSSFFHDSQMKSTLGKNPAELMRKPTEMGQSSSMSHSSSQSSLPDKRTGNIDRSPQMMNQQQTYYSSNYPTSRPLNTPPLHHSSMMALEDRNRNLTNRSPYEAPFPAALVPQGFGSMNPSYTANRFESDNMNFSHDSSGTQPLRHTPINSGGRKSANPPQPPQPSVVKPPQKQSSVPSLGPMSGPHPTQPQQSHRATTPHNSASQSTPTPTQVNQSRQTKQNSRTKASSSKKAKTLPPFMEVDSNLSNSIFETSRSMTPFFPMQNLSPQSRAMQHDGPSFLPGTFFGAAPRFPNSNTGMAKNSDITGPFNSLFPPRGSQNGLGLNFQPGYGINMNSLHGSHGSGPQLTPHSASHMANFSLNNIFTDSVTQNEPSLNISPIKFPHANSMLHHQGMDHNAMQHHHRYNQGHPSVMSINSILGPNHFDSRMTTSMAGPFHSHVHPSFIPPLNFSMHDH